MVSLWPWKGTDSSPASFEKTLSSLSSKITTSQSHLDQLHTSARRTKVLWTLYLGFAYLGLAIVLLLVVGHKNLGAYEWTGMAGGPILIYVARALISAYYNFRIDSLASRLKGFQEERARTIQKLKDATKYDSTMELIEKYGGEKKKRDKKEPPQDQDEDKKTKRRPPPSGTGRTNLPPPPTANIVHPSAQQQPPLRPQPQVQQHDGDAEFAPNAYASPAAPRTQYMVPEPHWYDRIFDVLLGEDETAAKNRFALICESCRLVNGQAPPGTKSLAEVGMWRCMGCGKINGEVDEGKRIVEEVLASKKVHDQEQDGSEAEAEAETQVANDSDKKEKEKESEPRVELKVTGSEGPAGSVKARRRNR